MGIVGIMGTVVVDDDDEYENKNEENENNEHENENDKDIMDVNKEFQKIIQKYNLFYNKFNENSKNNNSQSSYYNNDEKIKNIPKSKPILINPVIKHNFL